LCTLRCIVIEIDDNGTPWGSPCVPGRHCRTMGRIPASAFTRTSWRRAAWLRAVLDEPRFSPSDLIVASRGIPMLPAKALHSRAPERERRDAYHWFASHRSPATLLRAM